MSSAAFARFLEQYNSKGRSHGEGYAASHFDGLSDAERVQIEDMLLNAALKGDATAVSGLRLLGSERALQALSKVAQSAGSRTVAGVQAIAALLASRESIAELRSLLDAIVVGDQSTSWIALQAFPGDAPFSSEGRKVVAAALSKFILVEVDIIRRNVAAKKLLRVLGVRESDLEYKEYVLQLSSDSHDIRGALLSKLPLQIQ